MGKWLSSLVAALVLLALTSLLGGLLKGPIDGLANQSRLSAEVQLVPWVPKPTILSSEDANFPVTIDEGNLTEIVESLDFKMSSISDFGLAKMNIENGSSDVVSDINVRVATQFRVPEIVYLDADRKVHVVGASDRVMLPDMRPGDRIEVFFWGQFSSYSTQESFKTYSSEGQFRLNYEWPEVREFEYRSGLGRFLDDYAWTSFVLSVIIILLILSIVLGLHSEYVKGLLVSERLYKAEARKLRENPKKFQIDYAAAQSAWNVHQGRMKELVAEEEDPE